MKGILFKHWKAKAIAESSLDREWQTRRLDGLKEIDKEPDKWKPSYTYNDIPQSSEEDGVGYWFSNETTGETLFIKPRYQVGEVLYIKEVWWEQSGDIYYKAEWGEGNPVNMVCENGRWRSPLFMPAWAARYFIKITDVRPERLQEISHSPFDQDCHAEGFGNLSDLCLNDFMRTWDSINPKYPWASNPWVWVYLFKKVEK